MKWIQSSIIILSLTFLATCLAEKNEASRRGLKDAKGSKVQIKSSDKSSKFSKNEKAAKSDKSKSDKAYNPSHSK